MKMRTGTAQMGQLITSYVVGLDEEAHHLDLGQRGRGLARRQNGHRSCASSESWADKYIYLLAHISWFLSLLGHDRICRLHHPDAADEQT